MTKSHRSSRSHTNGTVGMTKLYSTDGAIGNLRYKSTAAKQKPNQKKAFIPLQVDELSIPLNERKEAPPQTAAGRKRVLEELGEMLSGKKSHK
jgi:hypothetical protein